jgi:hypothetical protein
MLDAVARGLQRGDAEGALGVFLVGGRRERRLLGDVEELADGDLPAHQRVDLPRGCRVRRVRESLLEQVVAPGDEEVAEQDRGGPPERRAVARPAGLRVRRLERTVRGGLSAPGVGVVDDVVVHERGGVEHLERGGGIEHGVRDLLRVPCDARDRRQPVTQNARADAFPGQGARRGIQEDLRFGAGIRPREALRCHEPCQSLGNGLDRVGGSVHGPSLVLDRTRRIDRTRCRSETARRGSMPLSEQEQRLLDEMERHLMNKDADVVSASRDGRTLSYRNIVYGTILVLVGLGGLIAGVSTGIIAIGVIAFVVMVAGVVLAAPRQGLAALKTSPEHKGQRKPSRTGSSSFMDRMNDRWDRRQDGS